MTRVSKYASCLNALDEMQQSVIYAARKGYLAEAESIIVRLESETAEQRQEIAQLTKKYQALVAYYDKHNGTPCAEIWWEDERKQLTAEIARLREAMRIVKDHLETPAFLEEILEEAMKEHP